MDLEKSDINNFCIFDDTTEPTKYISSITIDLEKTTSFLKNKGNKL